MKKILVTGSNGQLGSEIRRLSAAYPSFSFIFTDVDELDLTDFKAVDYFFSSNKINFCINCAAYTAVDKAEEEPALADLINFKAVEIVMDACKKSNSLLFHISTDYVFNGKNFLPFSENDAASPQSVYGRSKLKGEHVIMSKAEKAIIIRTSWLYSTYGNNFVKTILRLISEKKQIEVVNDQIGTPTFAGDLAKAILEILTKTNNKIIKEIYHFSNEGVASWYDFALAIAELSRSNCKIIPVDTSRFPTKATRPHYSVLNKTKIKIDFGLEIPYWRDSLKTVINELTIK